MDWWKARQRLDSGFTTKGSSEVTEKSLAGSNFVAAIGYGKGVMVT